MASESIAVYDGRTFLGTIEGTAKGFKAVSAAGERLGTFAKRQEASTAIRQHASQRPAA